MPQVLLLLFLRGKNPLVLKLQKVQCDMVDNGCRAPDSTGRTVQQPIFSRKNSKLYSPNSIDCIRIVLAVLILGETLLRKIECWISPVTYYIRILLSEQRNLKTLWKLFTVIRVELPDQSQIHFFYLDSLQGETFIWRHSLVGGCIRF